MTVLTACEAKPSLVVRESGLPTTGQWRSGFALGDLDGDGALDVLHGPPRQAPGPPRLWHRQGERFLEASVDWPAAIYDYGAAAIGDFDGDGDNDAAFAMHTVGVRVLLRDGWTFHEAGFVPFSSRAMVAAQLDDDPALELAAIADGPVAGASLSNSGVAVLDVDAGGSVRYRAIAASDGLLGDAITSADLDGDGAGDLACGSSIRGFRRLVYLRRGDVFEARDLPVGPQDVVRAVAARPAEQGSELVIAITPSGEGTPSRLLRWSPARAEPTWVETTHRVTALSSGGDVFIALTADGEALRLAGPGLIPGKPVAVSSGCAGQQALALGTKEDDTFVASFGSERSATCANGGAIVLLAAP